MGDLLFLSKELALESELNDMSEGEDVRVVSMEQFLKEIKEMADKTDKINTPKNCNPPLRCKTDRPKRLPPIEVMFVLISVAILTVVLLFVSNASAEDYFFSEDDSFSEYRAETYPHNQPDPEALNSICSSDLFLGVHFTDIPSRWNAVANRIDAAQKEYNRCGAFLVDLWRVTVGGEMPFTPIEPLSSKGDLGAPNWCEMEREQGEAHIAAALQTEIGVTSSVAACRRTIGLLYSLFTI